MSKFAEACKLSYEEWEATLPNIEDIPEPEYSKKHMKRMNKLFDRMRGGKYHRFTRRAVRIMIVAAVLVAILLSAFAIPSSREYLIENFDLFSVYKISEHNNNAVGGEIEVGYIPDGYELVEIDSLNKSVTNIYKAENGQTFEISKTSSSTQIDFDTENGMAETFSTNGIDYTCYARKNEFCGIMWISNDYIYQVRGNFTQEELLKIAENIK